MRTAGRWVRGVRAVAVSLLALLLALALALCVTVWLMVEDLPLVAPGRPVTATDLARAKTLLRQADPRQRPDGTVQRLALSEADVQLLLDDASRRLLGGAAQASFQDGRAVLEVAVPLAFLVRRWPGVRVLQPLGDWLNLSTDWRAEATGLPRLVKVRLGGVPVPSTWVVWAAEQAIRRQGFHAEVALARSVVDSVRFAPAQLSLNYRWRADLRDQVRAALVPPLEQARLHAYHLRLAELLAELLANAQADPQNGPGTADKRPVALGMLIAPLFELAGQRTLSQASLPLVGTDNTSNANSPAGLQAIAAQENKALLLTLALYAVEQNPARLVPTARQWPKLPAHTVLLGGRDDFAKHFLISAFVAAEGGGRLADAIGVYKEVVDARDGSGFSFNDLAADRAGTRFGQRAAHDAAQLQLQIRQHARPLRDADLLPDVGDLPEFLPEAEFRRQYGKIGSPAYAAQLDKIDARLRAMPLLQ